MNTSATAASGNTLLAYSIDTDPDPLQVSPANGGTSPGSLTIVVSNPTTTQYVYVSSIVFSFPEGTGAQALTNVDGGMVTAASPSSQWNFRQTGVGTFTATPASGDYVQMALNGAVFEISDILVNMAPGNVTLTIVETSSYKTTGFAQTNAYPIIPKFPYGFFCANFTPNVPGVNNGGTVTLTWEASDGPTYTLLSSGGQSIDVTEVRAWTSPPLSSTTVFLLQAVYQQGGESVVTSMTTTVVVLNGVSTLTSLTTGALAVTTSTAMIGAPQTLPSPVPQGGTPASASYTAPTDGLVLGFIGPAEAGTPTTVCIGWVTIQNSTNVFAIATGGSYLAATATPPSTGFSSASLNQSILLPVRSGETFTISVQLSAENTANPQTRFWYVPLGSGVAQVAAALAHAVALPCVTWVSPPEPCG